MTHGILYLNRATLEAHSWDYQSLVSDLKTCLLGEGERAPQSLPKLRLPLPGGGIQAMAGYAPEGSAAGIKWLSGYGANPERGLARHAGLCVVNDVSSGLPLAIVDAGWVTEVRTALMSLLALNAVGPPSGTSIALLGAGAQGRSHARILCHAMSHLARLTVFDPSPAAVDRLRAEVQAARPDVRVATADTPRNAARDADTIISMTPTTTPPRRDICATDLRDNAVALALDVDATFAGDVIDAAACFVATDKAHYRASIERGIYYQGYPDREPDDFVDVLREPALAGNSGPKVFLMIGVAVQDIVVAALAAEHLRETGVGNLLAY